MRTPLIAGNWKMHKTLADARELVAGLCERLTALSGAGTVEVLICPPAQLLFPMAKAVDGSTILLGAQNCHEETTGAFTGEISVPMIADTGATHVIVGHSERRQLFGEKGDRLAKKVRAVQAAGLTAIYCVGETLDQRDGGQMESVIQTQIADVVTADLDPEKLVIAYEPVWAIGTGKTASPEQAQEVHHLIREQLGGIFTHEVAQSLRILYGGSVKPGNATDLLHQPDIDGALVGGACLEADSFADVIQAAIST